jgi:CDP-diacylglycerol---serine O-phosphatidyltransferase
MISSIPTLGWSRLRPPNSLRLGVIAVVGLTVAALLTETWYTLVAITLIYLALIPIGLAVYARVRRQGPVQH